MKNPLEKLIKALVIYDYIEEANQIEFLTKLAANTYVVQSGDNPWTIAGKVYGDKAKHQILMDYNKITDPTKLKVGQVLKIPPIVTDGTRCTIMERDNFTQPALVQLADCVAKEIGISPAIFKGLIETESQWNPSVSSESGAKGLTQITQGVISTYGVMEPFNPVHNLYGGAKHLKKVIDRFAPYPNGLELALMAYHAGNTAVLNWYHAGRPDAGFETVGPLTLKYPKTVITNSGKY